jgi:hypothetical protein
MRIECTIPEIDNHVTLDGVTYKFERRSGNRSTPMLATVDNDTHAADILSRPGFSAWRDSDGALSDSDDELPPDDEDELPPDEDDALPPDAATGQAPQTAPAAPAEQTVAGAGQQGDSTPPDRFENMTFDELKDEYKRAFHRAAPTQAKYETLLNRLHEAAGKV